MQSINHIFLPCKKWRVKSRGQSNKVDFGRQVGTGLWGKEAERAGNREEHSGIGGNRGWVEEVVSEDQHGAEERGERKGKRAVQLKMVCDLGGV